MKTYSDRATTPLLYHELFLYAFVPLSILTNSYYVFSSVYSLIYQTVEPAYILLDLLFESAILIALCLTFWGLRKWKPLGWYAVHALNALLIIYHAIILYIIFNFYSEDELLISSEQYVYILKIVIAVLVSFYYWKRKGLFFPAEASKTPQNTNVITNLTEANSMSDTFEESLEPKTAVESNSLVSTQQPLPAPIQQSPAESAQHSPPKYVYQPDKKKTVVIISILLLFCSLIGNLVLFMDNASLRDDVAYYQSAYKQEKERGEKVYANLTKRLHEYQSIENAYNFYTRHAVIVTEHGSRYHTYDCHHWDYPIWIYNVEAAKDDGYTPCRVCNPPQ